MSKGSARCRGMAVVMVVRRWFGNHADARSLADISLMYDCYYSRRTN